MLIPWSENAIALRSYLSAKYNISDGTIFTAEAFAEGLLIEFPDSIPQPPSPSAPQPKTLPPLARETRHGLDP